MTTLTLAQAVWPRRTESQAAAWGRDMLLVTAFSVLTALSAQVTIHLPLVPITGQTFAVLLTGALLGPRLGMAAMLLYLGEGLAGLPVFAEGHSAWTVSAIPGIPTIFGPSAGYLISYPFAAGLIGWLATRGWDHKPLLMLAAMLLSSLLIYTFGAGWLAHFFGLRHAVPIGVLPFLPGDTLKALLAAGLLPAGWKLLGSGVNRPPDRLIIGTRGSKLALTQTQSVADTLRRLHPQLDIEIKTIQTRGDASQAANIPLASFSEKGIFAKELETALLAREIDIAVHSMKDMEHTLPPGLMIAAVPEREDPRDALIGSSLEALPQGARVGTGSVRRRALLLSRRPDLQMLEIRGNIDSRLRKWREGQYDAICLAVAGLNRLGLQENITEILDPDWFTPDPGQGALALQCRADNRRIADQLLALDDPVTQANITAERTFLRAFGGGCKTPIGALAIGYGWNLHLQGMAASPDGKTILRAETWGETPGARPPERHGEELAAALRAKGADTLLQRNQ